jgi:hypothetical protein
MERWEALLAILNVAILFVPIFVALFAVDSTGKLRGAARERRIAQYRKSPESWPLRLSD